MQVFLPRGLRWRRLVTLTSGDSGLSEPSRPRVGVFEFALLALLASTPALNGIQAYYNGDGILVLVTIYEPEWQLFVDLDGDRSTGYEGFEVVIRETGGETAVRSAEEFGYSPSGWGRLVYDSTLATYGSSLLARVPRDTVFLRYSLEVYEDGRSVAFVADQFGDPLAGLIDFCPFDSSKFAPGDCGCGKLDRFGCGLFDDRNRDGELDLRDFQLFQIGEKDGESDVPPEFSDHR